MSHYASEQAILNAQWNAAQETSVTEQARRAPHVLMRPAIFPDGNAWCALYGENIQEGVVGFGDTPAAAAADFDLAWTQQLKRPSGVAPAAPTYVESRLCTVEIPPPPRGPTRRAKVTRRTDGVRGDGNG